MPLRPPGPPAPPAPLRRARRIALGPWAAALAAGLLALGPTPGAAQSGTAVAGAAVGVLAGGYVSMAVMTARARQGHFLFSPAQARWELLPVPLLAVSAAVLGHQDAGRLWRTVGWSSVGTLGGAALGALVGRAAWGDAEGTWAGGVIGGGVGLLVGGLAGALTWDDDGPAAPVALVRIPAPW